MIVLLGASGYIGQAFARELQKRNHPFTALSRRKMDYSCFDVLLRFLRETKPAFRINSAGYTGKPNVDACEEFKADTLIGNTLLPQTIAHACTTAGIPWAHLSSGCIYNGAKIADAHGDPIEKNLNKPEVRTLLEKKSPSIRGFTETDEPNFTFRQPPCSFYSGTKALAEEAIADAGQNYIWRLRIALRRVR